MPGQIRDLVATDDARADAAIHELFGNNWHQRTVYPANAPAVAFPADALPAMACQTLGLPHDGGVWPTWLGARRRLLGLLPPG